MPDFSLYRKQEREREAAKLLAEQERLERKVLRGRHEGRTLVVPILTPTTGTTTRATTRTASPSARTLKTVSQLRTDLAVSKADAARLSPKGTRTDTTTRSQAELRATFHAEARAHGYENANGRSAARR